MTAPMKVAIVGHSYLAEENRKNLAALAERGVAVEVVSARNLRGMIFNYDLSTPLIATEAYNIRLYNRWRPPGCPPGVYCLRSFDLGFRRFRPDIVHIEGDPFTPLFLQAYAAARAFCPKAKIVCTVKQNTYTHRGPLRDWVKDRIARTLVPRVSRFIVVNRGVANIYRERFRARSDQLHDCTQLGVDADLFSPPDAEQRAAGRARFQLPRDEELVGYVGRLADYKGVVDLIEAVASFRERSGRNLCLALLGDGPLRDSLTERASQLGWLRVVHAVPHAEVAEFLQCLDFFVMPSRVLPHHVEHDAHALLEAMAVGLPCIGTLSGAIQDVLEGAGILVPPETPTAIRDGISSLVENAGRRHELAKLARARILERYSIPAVADKYVAVYRSVLGRT